MDRQHRKLFLGFCVTGILLVIGILCLKPIPQNRPPASLPIIESIASKPHIEATTHQNSNSATPPDLSTTTEAGSIVGRTVFADSRLPASNARIIASRVMNSQGNALEEFIASTNTEGYFEITGLPLHCSLRVQADHLEGLFVCHEPPEIQLSEDSPKKSVELMLAPGGSVSGRVFFSDTNEPIAGMTVTTGPVDFIGSKMKAITDASGKYSLRGLLVGRNSVECERPRSAIGPYYLERGHPMEIVTIAAPGATINVEFPFLTGLEISGHITAAGGAPVIGAKLSASTSKDGTTQSSQAISGGDGTFTFYGLVPQSEYWIFTAPNAHIGSTSRCYVDIQPVRDFDIILEQESIVSGSVVDTDGLPVSVTGLVMIPSLRSPENTYLPSTGKVSESGEFEVRNVRAGQYTFEVDVAGKHLVPLQSLDVPPAVTLDNVVLIVENSDNANTIAGRVLDALGNPIDGVMVIGSGKSQSFGPESTNNEGAFRIDRLTEASFELRFVHKEYGDVTLNAAPGETNLTVILPSPGTVAGKIVDARTNAPVTNFQLTVKGAKLDSGLELANGGYATAGEVTTEGLGPGEFRITDVTAGQLLLEVRGDGYERLELNDIAVGPGENVQGLLIPLRRTGLIRIRISAHEGARNRVYAKDTGSGEIFRSETDNGGEFLLNIPPGNYVVKAEAVQPDAGRLIQSRSLQVDFGIEAELEFDFSGTAAIFGTVTECEGDRSRFVYVRAGRQSNAFDPSTDDSDVIAETHTRPDGTYLIEGIPPGEYTITMHVTRLPTATEQQPRQQSETVALENGVITEVNFAS